MSTGRIPIELASESFSDQGRPDRKVKIRYTPRSSTPQSNSFSEMKEVTLAIETVLVASVGVTTSSNKFFSSWLMVEPRKLAGSLVLRSMLEKGEEGREKLAVKCDQKEPRKTKPYVPSTSAAYMA